MRPFVMKVLAYCFCAFGLVWTFGTDSEPSQLEPCITAWPAISGCMADPFRERPAVLRQHSGTKCYKEGQQQTASSGSTTTARKRAFGTSDDVPVGAWGFVKTSCSPIHARCMLVTPSELCVPVELHSEPFGRINRAHRPNNPHTRVDPTSFVT